MSMTPHGRDSAPPYPSSELVGRTIFTCNYEHTGTLGLLDYVWNAHSLCTGFNRCCMPSKWTFSPRLNSVTPYLRLRRLQYLPRLISYHFCSHRVHAPFRFTHDNAHYNVRDGDIWSGILWALTLIIYYATFSHDAKPSRFPFVWLYENAENSFCSKGKLDKRRCPMSQNYWKHVVCWPMISVVFEIKSQVTSHIV